MNALRIGCNLVSVPLTNKWCRSSGAASTGKRNMMKRICYLSSAALGVALLSACGSTEKVALDRSKLSTGDTNQVSTGGYIWTYTDHNKTPTETPTSESKTWNYHATISPITNPETKFVVTMDDAEHKNVLNVKGEVPIEIPWDLVSGQDPISIDTYWPTYYPDAMIPAYPAAGLGFGFQPENVPYDATEGGKYIGIAFDMKANINMDLVWVSMPTEETDLPDPANKDKFQKQCDYYTASNNPASGASSCFTNYRKGIFSASSIVGTGDAYNTMAPQGEWKRYCVLFSEFAVPSWASPTVIDKMAEEKNHFNPAHALKVQWDMYQPKDGTNLTPPAKFDVSIDNISLVTPGQIEANNCNPAAAGDAGLL
jgi:hypothetical protein